MANTRITQGVIKPNEDYDVRHINATGIITATNVNVSGVLTYEDVTSVDSIGIITARKGIVSSGVVTATAFHGDGSNLTGVDSTALKDPAGNVKIQAQASGAVHTGFSTMQNLRVTGIATFGTSSTVINGDQNTINVGTALTLGHTQGVQFHTQNLHSQGFEINQINASGIVTATTFSGSGASLTNLNASNIASGTVPTARLGSGTANSSTFLAGDSTFKTITGTTINNNADNRVITGSGTANTLNAESGLTFDGTNLDIDSDSGHLRIGADQDLDLYHNGSNGYLKNSTGQQLYRSETHTFENAAGSTEYLRINANGMIEMRSDMSSSGQENKNIFRFTDTDAGTGGNQSMGRLQWFSSDTSGNGACVKAEIEALASDTTPDGYMVFKTHNTGTTPTERLRITSGGRFGFNRSTPQYAMHLSPETGQSRIDLHMTNNTTGHGLGDGVQFGYQNSAGAYIWNFEDTDIYFGTTNNVRLYIRKSTGHLEPGADNAQNLGSSSKRWANIYTGDLQLSNVTPTSNGGEPVGSGGNEVDGTEGTWTIQEGSNDLFIINRVNGKKYKFNLTEVT